MLPEGTPAVETYLKINSHMKALLSPEVSLDEKIKSVAAATNLTMELGKKDFGDYLSILGAGNIEHLKKTDEGGEGAAKKTLLEHTKEKLEMVNLGLNLASAACSATGGRALLGPINVGRVAVLVAKAGVEAVSYMQKQAAPAA
jgi:hypothetical protein